MKHSRDFYVKRYAEMKDYMAEKGIEDPYSGSLNRFISDYETMKDEGSKNVMKDLRYFAQYETSYQTARAMLHKVREFGGGEKLKDLKSMSTRDFAERYLDELKAAQKEAESMFGRDYKAMIGIWWFGS